MVFITWKNGSLGLHLARGYFLDALKLLVLGTLLSGCHLSYVIESAYYQADLLNRRVPIEKVLHEPTLPESTKAKLKLAQEARVFAESELGLHHTKNYTSFVQLDQPYVTYAVSAAPRSELVSYTWSFPIVGKVPYLGFFREGKAITAAREMKAQGYDAIVRGVSAYSTLGWFQDPLLSSMTQYEDYDLVNTIIHETVHATLFIKSSAEFNEQLATFIGNVGSELFYQKREGAKSATLQHVQTENEDDKRFAQFIGKEIESLTAWYKAESLPLDENKRQARLKEIQARYNTVLKPQMKTDKYHRFTEGDMNNARLLLFQTYLRDYDDFERVFQKFGRDFKRFVDFCKGLENERDPAQAMRTFAKG